MTDVGRDSRGPPPPSPPASPRPRRKYPAPAAVTRPACRVAASASVQPLGCARPRGTPSRDGVSGRWRPPPEPCSPPPRCAPRSARHPADLRLPRKSRPWRARPPCGYFQRSPSARHAGAMSPDRPVGLAALAPRAADYVALRSSCSAASRRSSIDCQRVRNSWRGRGSARLPPERARPSSGKALRMELFERHPRRAKRRSAGGLPRRATCGPSPCRANSTNSAAPSLDAPRREPPAGAPLPSAPISARSASKTI